MITSDDLETLTSRQLHERAIDLAKAGGDLDWLWHLLGSIPSAEGQLGELDDSGLDVASVISAINARIRTDPSAQEILRPEYVAYLLEHQ
jgi:hypothetical protein